MTTEEEIRLLAGVMFDLVGECEIVFNNGSQMQFTLSRGPGPVITSSSGHGLRFTGGGHGISIRGGN